MIKQIIFPDRKDHRYWNSHFKYIINSAKYAGIDVKIEDIHNIKRGTCNLGIPVIIDGVYCIFDFQNTEECEYREPICPVFKFHFNPNKKSDEWIFPFGSSCFLDWERYYKYKEKIKYKAEGVILNNQQEYSKYQRREKVKKILKNSNLKVDFTITDREAYWMKFNNCLVHVFVGGHHEHSLDRAHLQAMAFGVCTISTEIFEELPFNKKLIDSEHYICCKEDYSDLIKTLEWCSHNRHICKQIGINASKLFEQTLEPKSIWNYVEEKINNYPKMGVIVCQEQN